MSLAGRITGLLLLALSTPAAADGIVGYRCDRAKDQLVLTYESAGDGADEVVRASRSQDRWNPGSLIASMKDADHIGTLKSVTKQCRLSDGKYKVTISPVPGNLNVQGRCGAWTTAAVNVFNGSKRILDQYQFEADCHDTVSPITTRIVIDSRKPSPTFTTVASSDFYK